MEESSLRDSSERSAIDAFQDARQEILLQFLPVIVDAGLLIEKEGLGLLDLPFDPDVLGDAVDLLAAGSTLDLDLGDLCRHGPRRAPCPARNRCDRRPSNGLGGGGSRGGRGGGARGGRDQETERCRHQQHQQREPRGPGHWMPPRGAGPGAGASGAVPEDGAAPVAGAATPGASEPLAAAPGATFCAARCRSRSSAFFWRSIRFCSLTILSWPSAMYESPG